MASAPPGRGSGPPVFGPLLIFALIGFCWLRTSNDIADREFRKLYYGGNPAMLREPPPKHVGFEDDSRRRE